MALVLENTFRVLLISYVRTRLSSHKCYHASDLRALPVLGSEEHWTPSERHVCRLQLRY